MRTKKLVAILLTLAMALTCLSVTAFAETEPVALSLGENPVTVPAGEEDYYRIVTFTPELTGYYLIDVDWEDPALCWVDAETISDGTYDYYILEAGVTYEVTVANMDEVEAEYIVYVEYFESLEILTPVSMEITKLPDETNYLRILVGSAPMLNGMEMDVTWSDGSITQWSYDEDGNWVGEYYLDWELIELSDDRAEVALRLPELQLEVTFEATLLGIAPVSMVLVDRTPVIYIQNSCGIDMADWGLGEGWYYLNLMGNDRELAITFSDGSTVTGVPGDVIYGLDIFTVDDQINEPWAADETYITYYYGSSGIDLQVQIIESPVESVELLTQPTNNTLMIDEDYNMVNADGEIIETTRQLLEGMSLKVNYKDGTSETFAAEDIEWMGYEGVDIPFVDGYPVDIWDAFLGILDEEGEPPCDIEMTLGYMGAEFSYTLSLVEEFAEEPPVDDPVNPPVDDPVEPPGDEPKDEPADEPKDEPEDTQKPDVEQIPDTGDEMVTMLVLVCSLVTLGAVLMTKKKMF